MSSVTIRAGGADVVLTDDEVDSALSVLNAHKRAEREAWEAQQREAGQVWTANYWRHHWQGSEEFFTEKEAVDFLLDGSDSGDLAMESVTRPDGTLIDRAALDEIDSARWQSGKFSPYTPPEPAPVPPETDPDTWTESLTLTDLRMTGEGMTNAFGRELARQFVGGPEVVGLDSDGRVVARLRWQEDGSLYGPCESPSAGHIVSLRAADGTVIPIMP